MLSPVQAANFIVSTTPQLIAAMNTANSNGEDDTISLDADISLNAVDNITNGPNGLPAVLPDAGHSLTLDGNGHAVTRLPAAPVFRITYVAAGAHLVLDNIAIENGSLVGESATPGAGILNHGLLEASNCSFSGNDQGTGLAQGGAIANDSSATAMIDSCTFAQNAAAGGGAISNNNGSILTVSNSTFFQNTADFGGGLLNISTATVTNSTFVENSAITAGAIGQLAGSLTLRSNTLWANVSTQYAGSDGAGLHSTGTLNFSNNIIANSSGPDCFFQSPSTNTNNLIEDGTCSPALSGDPLLSPLADNGGPTMTMALQITPSLSPAIDAGANCPPSDQRGEARDDGACDIGAYEADLSVLAPASPAASPGAVPADAEARPVPVLPALCFPLLVLALGFAARVFQHKT